MWQPWRGADYEGRRVLILGESCYDGVEDGVEKLCAPDHPVTSIERVRSVPRSPNRTLRKLTRAVTGLYDPTPEQAASAWDRYAFTNYVPVSVPPEATSFRPTRDAWKQAEGEWGGLLALLEPRVVLVLGNASWNSMPDTEVRPKVNIQGYILPDGSISMCFPVPHPSYGPPWTVFAAWIAAIDRYADDGDLETAATAFDAAKARTGSS